MLSFNLLNKKYYDAILLFKLVAVFYIFKKFKGYKISIYHNHFMGNYVNTINSIIIWTILCETTAKFLEGKTFKNTFYIWL